MANERKPSQSTSTSKSERPYKKLSPDEARSVGRALRRAMQTPGAFQPDQTPLEDKGPVARPPKVRPAPKG